MEIKGESWKSLTLPHGGKETLLKAVIQAIPTFIISVFLLPASLTKKMDSLLYRFFWLGSIKKKAIPWRKGEVLNDPKSEGGLGFQNFHLFNLSLLAKQCWRLLNEPEALWVRVLRGLYFPNGVFSSSRKGSSSSWIWESFCYAKQALDIGAIRVIGSGENTWFHKDPWVHPLHNQGHNISSNLDPPSRVKDWMNQEGTSWNFDLLRRHCTSEEVEAISHIQISLEGT
ncbi:unnamed protein product [Linum trigynum]|uniref:Uncharacterized protein n=1 Tax=Linum trigynum TaxID=586398 RepID=A0AAV2FEE7_9ROSI